MSSASDQNSVTQAKASLQTALSTNAKPAEIARLLTKLDAAERTQPLPQKNTVLALALLSSSALIVLLAAETHPSTVRIDGDITSRRLTLQLHSGGRILGATTTSNLRIAATQITPIDSLPSALEPKRRYTEVAINTSEPSSRITLEAVSLAPLTTIHMESQRGNRLNIEIEPQNKQPPRGPLRVTTTGRSTIERVSETGDSHQTETSDEIFTFDPTTGATIEFTPRQNTQSQCLICDPIEASLLQFIDNTQNGPEQSSITAGTLRRDIGESLLLSEFDFFATEKIHASIRSITVLPNGDLRTRFVGNVTNASFGNPNHRRPVALSYLDTWMADRSRAATYSAIVFLFGLLASLLRWTGVDIHGK